ncbi:intradiol ring-cleavage dioxygenase [Actinoplanes couchii]|uniref:3,4-dioxygenase subunit beta n=2 Tax=Actinoplanes couchii TaxID=403638 RepID=A0ABQ3WZI2_9ACTN|nr:3,4-dioxygenase subunit beta [Actinoplanes couchii]
MYQGRRLPRPDEEVTDQGLGFDLATLMRRRQLLRAFGAGAAVLGIAACTREPATPATPAPPATGAPSAAPASSPAAAGIRIPEETQGPFPGDGSNGPDVLERSGVVRSDVRASLDGSGPVPGVALALELTVSDLATGGGPLTGAAVYIWQCDRDGRYSMYSDGVTRQTFLRGVQIVDRAGKVRFTSVFPGCYPGRWPHVHFEVYPDRAGITDHTAVIATSQLAFPQGVCEEAYAQPGYRESAANLAGVTLDTDMVFRDDHAVTQMATVTGDAVQGYAASLAVHVDTRR